jgi:hypothetical protein
MWLALTIPEREAIIRTLDDPPQTLAELRPCYFESTSGGFARAPLGIESWRPISRSEE